MASFVCPRCGAESHNPTDAAEGYCGRCHEWTGAEKEYLADLLRRFRIGARLQRAGHPNPYGEAGITVDEARVLIALGDDALEELQHE
jgi:hypothetical protein